MAMKRAVNSLDAAAPRVMPMMMECVQMETSDMMRPETARERQLTSGAGSSVRPLQSLSLQMGCVLHSLGSDSAEDSPEVDLGESLLVVVVVVVMQLLLLLLELVAPQLLHPPPPPPCSTSRTSEGGDGGDAMVVGGTIIPFVVVLSRIGSASSVMSEAMSSCG